MATDNLLFEPLPDTDWGTVLNDNLQKVDDAISDSAPTTLDFGDTPDAGTSMEMSRADHEHGMPWLPPNPNNFFLNTHFNRMSLGGRTISSFPGVSADAWIIEASGDIAVSRNADDSGQGQNSSFLTINALGAGKTITLYQRIDNVKYLRGKTLSVEFIGPQNESGFTYFADFGDGRESMLTPSSTAHEFVVPTDATELEVGISFSMTGAINVQVYYATLLIAGNLQNPCPTHPADNAMRCLAKIQTSHVIANFLGASNGTARLMLYQAPLLNYLDVPGDYVVTAPEGGVGGKLDGGVLNCESGAFSIDNDNGFFFLVQEQNATPGTPSRINVKVATGEIL